MTTSINIDVRSDEYKRTQETLRRMSEGVVFITRKASPMTPEEIANFNKKPKIVDYIGML